MTTANPTSTGTTEAPSKLSRVGKRPIELPKGVTATVTATKIEIKGPKGTLSCGPFSNVDVKLENNAITVKAMVAGRDGARFQGLARALLANMVEGTAKGFNKSLQLVGTGYRAEVKGPVLNLALGFSHPINFKIPAGVKIEIPAESKGTIIHMSGPDKAVMGQTAATIRGFRPPEPYGGKGVRHMGEKVREKAGKAGGKGGK
jgi:large subunit ribosomal protein L6